MLERVREGNRAAEAVSEQEYGQVAAIRCGVGDGRVQVGSELFEAVEARPPALGTAVSASVEPIDAVAGGHKLRNGMWITPAMLARPVVQYDNCSGLITRQPGLPVEAQGAGAVCPSLAVSHRPYGAGRAPARNAGVKNHSSTRRVDS